MENDKSSLLDSLKIERGVQLRRRGGLSQWMYAGIALLVIAGAAGWYIWPDVISLLIVLRIGATAWGCFVFLDWYRFDLGLQLAQR